MSDSTILSIRKWFKRQTNQMIVKVYEDIYIMRISGLKFRNIGKKTGKSHERIRQIVYNIEQIILRDDDALKNILTENDYSFKKSNNEVIATNSINTLINGVDLYIIREGIAIPLDKNESINDVLSSIMSCIKINFVSVIEKENLIDNGEAVLPLLKSMGISIINKNNKHYAWSKKSRITTRALKAISNGRISKDLLISSVMRDIRARYVIDIKEEYLSIILDNINKDYEFVNIKHENDNTIFYGTKKGERLPVESAIINLINIGISDRKGIKDKILKKFNDITASSIMAVLSYSPIFYRIARNEYRVVYQGDS